MDFLWSQLVNFFFLLTLFVLVCEYVCYSTIKFHSQFSIAVKIQEYLHTSISEAEEKFNKYYLHITTNT